MRIERFENEIKILTIQVRFLRMKNLSTLFNQQLRHNQKGIPTLEDKCEEITKKAETGEDDTEHMKEWLNNWKDKL